MALRLIATDEQYTSPSYTRVYPLGVARGYGAVIEDVDGNRFLDFTAGIAVCSTGHCHPRVVAAIQQQAAKLLHMSGTDFYYGPQGDLAKKLAGIAPGRLSISIMIARTENGRHTKRMSVMSSTRSIRMTVRNVNMLPMENQKSIGSDWDMTCSRVTGSAFYHGNSVPS